MTTEHAIVDLDRMKRDDPKLYQAFKELHTKAIVLTAAKRAEGNNFFTYTTIVPERQQ